LTILFLFSSYIKEAGT